MVLMTMWVIDIAAFFTSGAVGRGDSSWAD
jgi:hypothetical protein